MRLSRNPKLLFERAEDDNQRRHGRIRCRQTSCCAGEVLDLSASGMRIKRRGKALMAVDDTFVITIKSPDDSMPLSISTRVIWIKREGFRKHLIGLAFIDLDSTTATRLAEVARNACDQTVFRCA